ncbi:hypothetical protein B1F79_04120 [Coxiella-like endosymbiont of Rhipicephalus sanguineus]|uniref:hypothetical protein n=1 Tax=Coxiella-like endosymbiont of Rhipicephalus sanguineus TaxID=1955402 RepID=UPI00203A5C05|nr:hypothetical protein [Coxiella-like endosymbiont of Rhipicephalus sanguineus]MBT8506671.1 hypothetical protein [Coxiella-like endosymbiont of Rhipicephalus sanguineus]
MMNLVKDKSLYNRSRFIAVWLNSEAASLLKKGENRLTTSEQIEFNKNLIQSIFSSAINPVSEWRNGVSFWMFSQFQSIDFYHAWLGLDDRSLGILHRNVIKEAVKDGYLNSSLRFVIIKFFVKKDTIIDQKGVPLHGFLNIGRTLNSDFAMPEVKYRP